jgi:PAS domain S-box-containing protein
VNSVNKSVTKNLKQPPTQPDVTLVELEKYRLLVESVQDYAIFLLDRDGHVTTWNKGAEKNKGYSAEEIIGKHFSVFYLPHDIATKKPERELELAQQFGRVEDEDWRRRKDGSQFWANVVITALYSPDGDLVGFAKVTRDLTERKQQEERLRHANLVLQRQQRELEQLNSSKDEFISLASHQLRTPATSIKQYLGMLLEGFLGELSPEQLHHILKAYQSNERQICIVNNLLKVAQIDSGKVTLRKTPTDILALLQDIAEDQRESFTKRSQRISVTAPSTLPPAWIDANYVRMALDNIVDNASKYTPESGEIAISARARGDSVIIIIKDSGVGIAEPDIKRLFQKFSRIPNSLSDTVGGSGLGLYWVFRVLKLHGGSISVKSKLGEGTAFEVALPTGESNA